MYLVDYSNSRGAVDMGLLPDPGGLTLEQILSALDLGRYGSSARIRLSALASKKAFIVVRRCSRPRRRRWQIVFPAASAYEVRL
jgi:hypothetical protein